MRIDEINEETQSFTIANPRLAGNVLTVNPPLFRGRGSSTQLHGWENGWDTVPNWECLFVRQQGLFLSVYEG